MRKPKILFVDDEQLILDALRRLLRGRAREWDMEFVNEPAKALASHAAMPADVIVSDVNMPGLSGLELAMKAKRGNPATRVVILTGTANLNTAVEAINEAGVFRFYTKPCPADQLISAIEAALRDGMSATSSGERVSGLRTAGEAALDRLAIGIIAVDADCRIGFLNTEAVRVLRAADGLATDGGRTLRAWRQDDTAELNRVVAQTIAGTDDASPTTLAIQRPSMGRPYSIRVTPLNEGREPKALLFIGDPESPPTIDPQMIARMFGLSTSESLVAAAIARGDTLEDAAREIGITLSTARTYLKQVFSKTDTGRQAELVTLILTSPAIVAR